MKMPRKKGELHHNCKGTFSCATMEDNGALEPGAPARTCFHSPLPASRRDLAPAAFTLVEVMIGTVATTVMLIGLYAGFTFGFQQMQLGRTEARATQILEEKMELVRILNWDQVANYPGYVPTNFVESFYASNFTNTPSGGFNYTGTVAITTPSISTTYQSDLRMVTVTVNWQFAGQTRTRTMSAFVSQWGMQNYVY